MYANTSQSGTAYLASPLQAYLEGKIANKRPMATTAHLIIQL